MSSNVSAKDYLNEWASIPNNKLFDDTFPSKIGMDKDDLENYLYYTFLCTMFYDRIGQKGATLPDLTPRNQERSGEITDVDNCHTRPNHSRPAVEAMSAERVDNWHTQSDYVGLIESEESYILINTGLYNCETESFRCDDYLPYYMIFDKNRQANRQPWYYCGIHKPGEATAFGHLLRHEVSSLPLHVDLLTEKKYIIFDKEKLSGWDSKCKMNIDIEHIRQRDTQDRIKGATGREFNNNSEYESFIVDSITKSCYRTTFDYKYAIPYIYYDSRNKLLKRGFLLPIGDGKKDHDPVAGSSAWFVL